MVRLNTPHPTSNFTDGKLLQHNHINNPSNKNCNYNHTAINSRQYCRSHPNDRSNFKIFHQNVRGLIKNIDELSFSLSEIKPQVLCISEHHMRPEEINIINLDQYTLGAQYCRTPQTGWCLDILAWQRGNGCHRPK